jgi:hypothetical protein
MILSPLYFLSFIVIPSTIPIPETEAAAHMPIKKTSRPLSVFREARSGHREKTSEIGIVGMNEGDEQGGGVPFLAA